jgi:hypothetical protein
MKKFDWLLLAGIVLFLLAGTFFLLFYFNYQNGECMANPLVYGAKQIEKSADVIVYGSIMLLNPDGKRAPDILFNSTHLRILEKN